jgi:sugar/nucleoside kinase (ribokinase family)
MYDLISVGDATMDVFVKINDASVSCDIDTHECKLCLSYADKIAAEEVNFIIGGNAANAAVSSRRLGLATAFLSTIGDDTTGKQILDIFQKEGVSLEHLSVAPGTASNYSVVINFQAERTILVHHVARTYGWNITQPPKWFYLTSMGEGYEAIYNQVIMTAKQTHASVAFNPGTHQLKAGLESIRAAIAASAIFIVNKEEAAHILGLTKLPLVQELLVGLKNLGPEIVVITDGQAGAYAFDGQQTFHMGIYVGPVVERTGAGDAFGSAFTVAISQGRTIPEALQWGTANSTSVVAHIGPQAGLLDQQGIAKMIASNPTILPTQL